MILVIALLFLGSRLLFALYLAALMLSFPVIATQLWRFVAPGLYVKEKKAFLPFLLMTPIFFGAGACFAYFVAMPWALQLLLSYQGDVGGVTQEAGAARGPLLHELRHEPRQRRWRPRSSRCGYRRTSGEVESYAAHRFEMNVGHHDYVPIYCTWMYSPSRVS